MLNEFPLSTEAELCAKSDGAQEEAMRRAELVAVDLRSDLTHKIAELTETKETAQMLERLASLLRMVTPGEQELRLETLDQGTSRIAVAETRAPRVTAGGELHCGSSERYETRVTVGATTLTVISRSKLSARAEHETRALARVAALQIELNARKPWQPAQGASSLRSLATGDGSRAAEETYRVKLEREIKRLAASPFNVLLTGETGTGKTTIAKEIHHRSARAKKQFLDFNCAALPEHLAEAELFGYKKGAFTGANSDHPGLFEAAIGGTLFLDEVGELSLAIQGKLLKAIEERKVRRLGENHDRECDVRIIVATARNLKEMIRAGTFREDLYYRLATLNMQVLPLRERRGEIPGLIDCFLAEAAREQAKLTGVQPIFSIELRGVELLCGFEWTGNIRMLRNAVLELTSYVIDDEPITSEAVRAHLAYLVAHHSSNGAAYGVIPASGALKAPASARDVLAACGIVLEDGDMIVPLEACVVRRRETLDQWQDRAMISCIDAARTEHGRWASAAQRLGMVDVSLRHRRRNAAKRLAG